MQTHWTFLSVDKHRPLPGMGGEAAAHKENEGLSWLSTGQGSGIFLSLLALKITLMSK